MSYVDTFALSTGSIGTTQARTYGFAPGALICFGVDRSSATDVAGSPGGNTANFSCGFATGAASRACRAIVLSDAQTSETSYASWATDEIAQVLTSPGGPTVIGQWDISSFDASGATFVVDQQNASGLRLHTLAIPAARIANAEVGSFTSPTSPGTQDVTLSGAFNADVILILGRSVTSPTNSAFISIGCLARNSFTDNAVSTLLSVDASDPSDSASYSRSGECIAVATNTSTFLFRATASWITNGFRINWTSASAAVPFSYLALKAAPGFAFELATGTTATDTTPFSIPYRAITPDSGLVLSCCRAESSAGTMTANAELSIGAFAPSGTTTQVAMSLLGVDGGANSLTGTSIDYNSVYNKTTNPPSASLDGEMAVSALGVRSAQFTMANADPAGSFFWVLASGPAVRMPRGSPIFF